MKQFKLMKKFYNLHAAILIAVCSMLYLSGADSFAQNNPYSINDQCYQYFLSAESNFNSSKALEYCSQMREHALSVNDSKAEVMSYVIEMEYYSNHLDKEDEFLSVVETVKKEATDKGFPNYYYYAFSKQVKFLLSKGESITALYVAESMLEDAETTGNKFGLRTSYYIMADIYKNRGDIPGARRCYNQAVKYSITDNNEDLMDILLAKSQTYGNLDSALFYINRAKKYMVSPNDTLSVQKSVCFAYGSAGNVSAYKSARNSFLATYKKYGIEKHIQDSLMFRFYDAYLIEKEYEDAKDICKKFTDKQQSILCLRNIALAEGDYKQAYQYLIDLVAYNDSLSVALSSRDLNEVDAKFRNNILIQEKEDLELSSEREILRQQNNFYIILFGIFFVVLFLALDFAFFYIKQKNLAMENQKALTEDLMVTTEAAQRAKEMAIKAKDEAIKANNMKTTFVQNMSHEIRTPLNAIVGFSQLMSLPDGFLSDEERQQYGKYILSNSNLLTMLIDDILNINDIESGNYKVNITSSLCNDMCREAMNSVEYRVPPGVKYSFDSDVDDSFQITTDERRVRQVLINFLTNACKHTEKGEINLHFKVDTDRQMAIFAVTDTGTGIPADKVDSVFERFTKLDTFKQGAGLGLNICRMIAQKLEGTVSVDTSYKDGARFLLSIPLNYKASLDLSSQKI